MQIDQLLHAMAECDVQEAVIVNRGFQFQNHWHFNHQIKCVIQQTSDTVLVFYNVGSGNIASLCPYNQHNPRIKHSLTSNVSALIYVRKFRLLVASCPDLTLRIYSEHFELIDTVHIKATVLSLTFNEATSELYTGGIGRLNTWLLRHQLHNPLIPSKPFAACSVKKHQWVISLDFDPNSEILVATCQDAVYVINTRTHSQINSFTNTHHGSLTRAVFFYPLEYVITAAKDGSLKVWSCILNSEVHTLTGHLKAVTGLKVHPTAPCVISCSLDGSIRTWNLENMTQCCCVVCVEQLLGMCTDFPLGNRLACYSRYSLMMWQVNQVETHFATINSHMVSMSRVEDSSQCVTKKCAKARILALAEDGGVRLLSPVTGQVLKILFPMSSSQLLRDVVYSLKDSLFFALLKTSEVIVFDATTNPCSARQLWVAPSDRQLLSIAMCCVLLVNGDICCLVFGGEKSGHIALLFSSGEKLSMPHPCPAHGGHVTKLIASCDTIVPLCSDDQHQSSTKIVQTALISYGTDDMLNIWCLQLKKKDQVTLKLQISIHIGLEPVHGKLFASLLCLSFPDNRIVMINTPKVQQRQQDARVIAMTHSFSKMSLLTHQAEDDHTSAIIALQCCPRLSLFATSSKDGYVKVWNEENHLVSEIEFGESLASVCFSNSHGDLLVGFQKHVSLIQARDYLPKAIIDANYRDTILEDCMEQPMTFDSDLEFWYDLERTPCFPAEQEGRKHWNHNGDSGTDRVDHQPTIEENYQSLMTSVTKTSAAEMRDSTKSLQSKVDSCMAQKLSQQYAEELCSQSPSKLIMKKHGRMPHRVAESRGERNTEHVMLPTISSLPVLSHSSSSCLHESVSSGHLACAARGKSSRMRRDSSSRPAQLSRRKMSMTRKVLPKAEVVPLQVPSAKFPIAPDGIIPNSVLRRKFKYTPPVVILKPYQPPDIRLKVEKNREASDFNLRRSGSNGSCISTAISGEQFIDYSGSNDVIGTRVSRQLSRLSQEEQNRQPTASKREKSSYGGFLHPNTAESGPKFDRNESQYSVTFSPSSNFTSTNLSSRFEHKASEVDIHHNIQDLSPNRDDKASEMFKISGMDDTSKFSKTEKQATGGLGESQLGSGATNALVADHRSYDHTAHARPVQLEVHHATLPIDLNHSGSELNLKLSREEPAAKSFPKRSSSYVILKGIPVKLDSLHVVALQKIQNSSWYPKDRRDAQQQGDSEGLMEVIDTLISLQENSTMPIFKEICSTLLELNEGGALEEGQKMAIANQLSRKLSLSLTESESSTDNAPLRTAALRTLEKIGVGSKQVILRILPLLTDPNVEVRNAAFSALRSITGVANRSQLQRLLVKLGLLQHVTTDQDKVMSGLADRVDNGSIQLSPNSRILDVCKVGANFGQRMADSNSIDCGSNATFRDPFATKLRTDSGLPTSSRSRKKKRSHTLSESTAQSTKQQYGPLEPFNNSSPSHVIQRRTYHGCENDRDFSRAVTWGHFSQSGYGTNSLSMQGEGLFICGCLPNAAAQCHAFKVSTRSKIQELILRRPTDYSQSRSAARMMMLGVCGSKGVKKLMAEEYEWSDIFRVARRASRSVSHLSPEFTSVPQACFGVLYETFQPASRRVLKLPQIDTKRAKIDQTCGSQLINEQLRNVDDDQKNISRSTPEAVNLFHGLQSRECDADSDNAGLVNKLPEIASDTVRVAQKLFLTS